MAIEFKVRNEANCSIKVRVIDLFNSNACCSKDIESGETDGFEVENDVSKTGSIRFFVSRSTSCDENELPEHSDPYHGEVIVVAGGNLP